MRKVYLKPNDFGFEEELGEYLTLVPIANGDEINTLIYYIGHDGSVGIQNRLAVLIKSDNNNYYPVSEIEEDEIIEDLEIE